MADDERQFESEFEKMDLDRLSSDLKGLCRPAESVPPEVDRRIMDLANQKLRHHSVGK